MRKILDTQNLLKFTEVRKVLHNLTQDGVFSAETSLVFIGYD